MLIHLMHNCGDFCRQGEGEAYKDDEIRSLSLRSSQPWGGGRGGGRQMCRQRGIPKCLGAVMAVVKVQQAQRDENGVLRDPCLSQRGVN